MRSLDVFVTNGTQEWRGIGKEGACPALSHALATPKCFLRPRGLSPVLSPSVPLRGGESAPPASGCLLSPCGSGTCHRENGVGLRSFSGAAEEGSAGAPMLGGSEQLLSPPEQIARNALRLSLLYPAFARLFSF